MLIIFIELFLRQKANKNHYLFILLQQEQNQKIYLIVILDATSANLERYDAWRGKRTSIDPDGPTGADEMRAQMRQSAIFWGVVIGAGVVLVVVGLLL